MKINEETRKSLIESFKRDKKEFDEIFKTVILETKAASSVEEIMVAKKMLLIKLLRGLPLGRSECYFCTDDDTFKSCKECLYGKAHGICCEGDDAREKKIKIPTYDKITNLQEKMVEVIRHEFWYGTEVKK
jgi:hypothetical protein